jgi:hypothetical protein
MALLALFALAVGSNPSEGFDISALSPQEQKEFAVVQKRLAGPSRFMDPEPRWVKPCRTGSVSWLYVMTYEGYLHPSASCLKAYALDGKWQTVTKFKFDTGWRVWLEGAKLSENRWFSQPILTVVGQAERPLVLDANGFLPKNSPPADSIMHQSYIVTESGVRLVRLQTAGGKMIPNNYGYGNHTVGPPTFRRTLQQWTADLNSTSPLRQLGSMVWLAGRHLNSLEPRDGGIGSLEPLEDCKAFERMRLDPAIRSRLEELGKSKHPWVRRQAEYTLIRLSLPLERVWFKHYPKRSR